MGGVVSNNAAKILMISARSDVGGGPGHMYALAKGLDEKVNVFAALPSDGLFYARFFELLGTEKVFEIPRQKFTFKALVGLLFFCKRHRVALIHSHGKGAGTYSRLLGMLLGIPIIHTLHGYHDVKYGGFGKRLYAMWEKLAGFVTTKVICVSTSEAKLFRHKVNAPEQKIVVIPNGTSISTEFAEQTSPKKVVTVARIDYQKNLLEYCRVAKLLPDYDFFVIGDGGGRAEIENFIRENDVQNVTLCGESRTVLDDIKDAALYLTTSRVEGLPLAVLEAMSLGVPVVASDVVGNRDAVAEGITGYLYPLGDLDACEARIVDALQLDRNLIQSYHRAHFSSEIMVNKTLTVYQQVLVGQGKA